MTTLDSAVRWEGNNLEAIRDFLAEKLPEWPALIEKSGQACEIVIIDPSVHQEVQVLLAISLEDGDGLAIDQEGLLGVLRGILWQSEQSRH